jgi:hypothetical protein
MSMEKPGKPKPEEGVAPCTYCGFHELYRPAPKYARCLGCGKTEDRGKP